jgi:outer membrane immunogenic protein
MYFPVIATTVMVFVISAPAVATAQTLTSADWAGGYYGVTLGYADGNSGHINSGADTGGPGISGGSVGVTYGRNFSPASGAFIFGFEVDAAVMDLAGELPAGFHNGFNCAGGPCETDISWLATLRGRIGVPQGNTLLYGTAGLAIGGVEATVANFPALDIGTQAQVGWTAGVGAEVRMNDRMTLKGEILYTDLGESQYDDGTTFDAPFYVRTEFTQVRLGVNFRF